MSPDLSCNLLQRLLGRCLSWDFFFGLLYADRVITLFLNTAPGCASSFGCFFNHKGGMTLWTGFLDGLIP